MIKGQRDEQLQKKGSKDGWIGPSDKNEDRQMETDKGRDFPGRFRGGTLSGWPLILHQ